MQKWRSPRMGSLWALAIGALVFFQACSTPTSSTSSTPSTASGGPASVTLSAQSGAIAAAAVGSATFPVTTANLADGTVGTFAWYTTSAGTASASAPPGITPTVTALASNGATVTMAATSYGVAGTYYFTLTEGSAVSAVTSLTISSGGTPVVSLAAQSGTLVAGTAGSATFSATTANVSSGTAGTFTWYSTSAGNTPTSGPSGITTAVSAVSGNTATVTLTTTAGAAGGTYYFKLTEGSAVSGVGTLTVLTPINALAIPGVTAPVLGATPVTTLGTSQYTGTISWSPTVTGTFAAATAYTATITLTPTTAYTLTGVAANSFTLSGASSVTNSAHSGTVTAVFPATGSAVITTLAIPGVTAPVWGAAPVTTLGTSQYTGTVTWSPPVTSTFAAFTAYTATLTLTPAAGYNLTGVAANSFTLSGASSVTNSANSGTVTAVFPATGLAAWAQTLTSGSGTAFFNSVTIDPNGNTYAVGQIYGTGTYGFGNSVSATGPCTGYNTVIVKYNSTGVAQWAQTLTSGASGASFTGVTSDASGNAYAVGSISNGTYGFGNGVTATGSSGNYGNPVIVKYNSSGVAQWAQTLTSGANGASFTGVTGDSSGNTYAVGYIDYGTYGFGNGVTATGNNNQITVIVKYNSAGQAQWATPLTSGVSGSLFYGVTNDTSGNTYAVGNIYGTCVYNFGNSVTVTGTCTSGYNSVIVKYNSSGVAQWAKTLTSGSGEVSFKGVSVDTSGNTYAVGCATGTGTYGFGNSVTATGTASQNNVIVKYNSTGAAQWAQTLTSGAGQCGFSGVTIDTSGNTYAVGRTGVGTCDFGNAVTATGTASQNNVIVKYNSAGQAQWAQTLTAGWGYCYFNGVTIDTSGNTYAVGSIANGTTGFGNGVTAAGISTGYNCVIVKYKAY